MANGSLNKIKQTGIYQVRFRFSGRQYSKSLQTKSSQEAKDRLGEIRSTLRKLEMGDLVLPHDADVALFVTTGGKLAERATANDISLADVFAQYHRDLPHGAKAPMTISIEKIHFSHLRRQFGDNTPFRTITTEKLQQYATARSKTKAATTIKKELASFSVVWHWAETHLKLVQGKCPTVGVAISKTDEKAPFMTYAEIQAKIERGGLNEKEIKGLWDCMFLTNDEITEFLAFAKTQCEAKKLPAFLYPMVVAACLTGARRSELSRSEVDDWKNGYVQIREKKRRHKGSFRTVSIHPKLEQVMKEWMKNHKGRWMFYTTPNEELTVIQASHFLERLTEKTKWANLKGWHTFRHSFASNLAAAGVHQAVINSWMGHQTLDMQARYRHLFPAEKANAMAALAIA